jgi:hypothetical protein
MTIRNELFSPLENQGGEDPHLLFLFFQSKGPGKNEVPCTAPIQQVAPGISRSSCSSRAFRNELRRIFKTK